MPAQATAPTRSLVTIVLLALALAGCQVRVDSDIELREDETAVLDLALGIMLQEGLPTDGASDEALTAEDAQEGIEQSAQTCGFDPAAASAEPYEADGFEGARVRLDGVSFDAVTCFLTADEEMQLFDRFELSREGDDFVLDAEVPDLAAAFSEGLTGQKRGDKAVDVAVEGGATDVPTDLPTDLGTELDDALEQLEGLEDALGGGLENPAELFEITVRVTFPGDISDHNATRVEGTTAIWELDGSGGELMARGSAGSGGGLGGILAIVLIVGGLLLLALIVLLLLRRRRQGSSSPTDPSQPGYGAPPQGQPGYGAPPQGQPGYGAPPQGQPGYGAPPQGQPGYGAVPAPDHLPWGQPPPSGQQPPPAPAPSQAPPAPPPSGPPPAVWGDDVPPPVPSPQDQPAQTPPPPAGQPSPSSDEPYNPNATRTFRPEDLLPPSDPPQNQ